MALLDRFKKKEKKEEVSKEAPRVEEEKSQEEPVKKEPKKKEPKKVAGKQLVQAYRIIKEPHITEKATFLGEQNKYVFKIPPFANKIEVKKAIEALYGVKVKDVHLVHLPPKRRRLGRHEGWRGGLRKGFKKAIVTLAEGEKIELLPK